MRARSDAGRVLVVDDDANNRETLARRLTQRGYRVSVAENGPRALEEILREHYDLVLLDQMMPGMTGMDVLRLLRATYSQSELPVIMVSGIDEADTVVEALRLGANDYVVKPVDVVVVAARLQSQLDRSRADRKARMTDALTGLPNRSFLLERLCHLLARPSESTVRSFAVLCLDIDGFKAINESLGHRAGDQVLLETAVRLRSAVAQSDVAVEASTIIRIGGGEFAVLLENADPEVPTRVAEAILGGLKRPATVGKRELMLTAAIGITVSSEADTPEELLRDADLAKHRAKELGRNRWQLFEPSLKASAEARMAMAVDLRQALDRREFVAVYQPEIDLRTGRIVGFECLLRWSHLERGWVMPSEFIPVAEDTDLIIPIGAWLLNEAAHQLKAWQTRYPAAPPLTLNVNLSVKQLADPDLINRVTTALNETGIPAETFGLELTESVLMNDLEAAQTVLHHLQSLGVRLKLDDFGTGYSSLSYLRSLNFSSLKIDRSFVSKLVSDAETRAIVKMVIDLAHKLHMTVIAEGIEDERQLSELARMGCDAGQGYHLSVPLKAEDAEQLLAEGCRAGGTRVWAAPRQAPKNSNESD